MATFQNISGSDIVINDEYGQSISFKKNETRSGLSNYLDNFTRTYQVGEKILLRRIGDLDLGGMPSPSLFKNNVYAPTGQPNHAIQGVNWGDSGGLRGDVDDVIQTTFPDVENDSKRLLKVAIRTNTNDERVRVIDTRLIGANGEISNAGEVLPSKFETFGPDFLDQGGGSDERSFETCSRITNNPYGFAASQENVANTVYGPLLTINKYYFAFGLIRIYDDSTGLTENIGFRIDLDDPNTMILTKDIPDAFTGFSVLVDQTTDDLYFGNPIPTTTITFTRVGGDAADTISMEIYYGLGLGIAEGIAMNFSAEDEIRGWYTFQDEVLFYLSNAGIYEFRSGVPPRFVAW